MHVEAPMYATACFPYDVHAYVRNVHAMYTEHRRYGIDFGVVLLLLC